MKMKKIGLILLMLLVLSGCKNDDVQEIKAKVILDNTPTIQITNIDDNRGNDSTWNTGWLNGTKWYTITEGEKGDRVVLTFPGGQSVRFQNNNASDDSRYMEGFYDGDYIVITKAGGYNTVKTYAIKYLGNKAMILEESDGNSVTYVYEGSIEN